MKMFGFNRFASIALLTTGLLAGPALTPAAAQMTPEQACTGDAQSLCNEFIPDRAKVGACLRRNASRLSADCRGFVVGGRHHTPRGRTHVRVHRHSRHHK